jgi:hypothetical protein
MAHIRNAVLMVIGLLTLLALVFITTDSLAEVYPAPVPHPLPLTVCQSRWTYEIKEGFSC